MAVKAMEAVGEEKEKEREIEEEEVVVMVKKLGHRPHIWDQVLPDILDVSPGDQQRCQRCQEELQTQ